MIRLDYFIYLNYQLCFSNYYPPRFMYQPLAYPSSLSPQLYLADTKSANPYN